MVFFRLLNRYNGDKTGLLALYMRQTPISEWLDEYNKDIERERSEDRKKMPGVNPEYILKSYIQQEA